MLDITTPKWYILNTGKGGGIIFNKASFTLVEIIVILVLISILYSIAVPTYEKLMEKNKAEAANFNLVSIYNAEKRYKLDMGTNQYFACGATCNMNTLNNTLSTYINDNNFTYGIVLDAVEGFRAQATRVGGNLCNGNKMTITGTNSEITKGCSVW